MYEHKKTKHRQLPRNNRRDARRIFGCGGTNCWRSIAVAPGTFIFSNVACTRGDGGAQTPPFLVYTVERSP